jgi:hypothetical protein
MMRIAAGAFRKRMPQQPAGFRISRHHTQPDHVEVLSRLLVIPRPTVRRQRLQLHRRAEGMARDAPSVARAFRREHGLDTRFEEFEVKGRRRGRLLNARRGSGDEQTNDGQ